MTAKLIALVMYVAFLFTNVATAQTISGKIIDNSSKQPLSGVSVKVVGGLAGTSADEKGNFTIKAGPQSRLDITQVGYLSKRVSVNG